MSDIKVRAYVYDKEGKADAKKDKNGEKYIKLSAVFIEGYKCGGVYYPDTGVFSISGSKLVDYRGEISDLKAQIEDLKNRRI